MVEPKKTIDLGFSPDEMKRISANDMRLTIEATPAQKALAEIVKIAMPGLKMAPVTLACTIERMLAGRGFRIISESQRRDSPHHP